LTLIAKRDVETECQETEDHGQEWQEWRAQWDRSFLDIVTTVDFLLENTSEDDMIRAPLLDLDWSRFTIFGREHFVTIVTKWPGYAVDLMARQAKDDWILRQAERIEEEKASIIVDEATT